MALHHQETLPSCRRLQEGPEKDLDFASQGYTFFKEDSFPWRQLQLGPFFWPSPELLQLVITGQLPGDNAHLLRSHFTPSLVLGLKSFQLC